MKRPTDLTALLDRWAGVPVVVVGDAMLDEWRFVRPERLAREAPAPVVRLHRRKDAAGGAGNTAVNLARLGARPTLVAPVGVDGPGDRLRHCLAEAAVRDRTVPVAGFGTPVKRRLLAGEQIVVREDEGAQTSRLPLAAEKLLAELETATGAAAILVVCDYGLGTLADPVRSWLIDNRSRFGTVALDAHELRPWQGLSPTVVTPSFTEAVQALGEPSPRDTADRVSQTLALVTDLVRVTGADIVAVTLDAEGAVVADRFGHTYRTSTGTVPPSHAVGAGDVYLAALTVAVWAGAPLRSAADLAQLAASVSVCDVGTCVCEPALLDAAAGGVPPAATKVVDPATLIRQIREHRRRGARVVFTNGCFDVLHRGHVGYLEEGSHLGDVLVVAVNGDQSVRRLKGLDRPVNRAEDRAAVLAALSCVDYVTVFDEDSPAALIEAVRPDVYVKGGDYPAELVPEAPVVRRLGGEVRILGYVADRSTSAIIERIRSRNHPAAVSESRHDDS